MADYSKIPSTAKLQPKPHKAHIDDDKLQHMLDLLKLSPIGPAVFENTSTSQGETKVSRPDRRYGMRRDWLTNAKHHWLNTFSWRHHEDHLNSFPQFTVPIKDKDGHDHTIHFMALFSSRKDAIPLAFFHGWPGSFMEFLPLFTLLKQKYTPATLPYHVIAPSLTGYAYSSGPPVEVDWTLDRTSEIMHTLLTTVLGFPAYLVQGGDLGSTVSRFLAANYDECKGMHLNAYFVPPPADEAKAKEMDALEAEGLKRGDEWRKSGMAYAMEHGTRTGTIGLALSASPLAMLSWIGEKFLEWTDEDPALETILASVSLYWLTETFPRCIYPYRTLFGPKGRGPPQFVAKPSGYSFFPKELVPVPRCWAAATADIVSYSQHEGGGHFAALEKPKELLEDVEEWVSKAWKESGAKL
ncbi:hypothetical protein LTR62_000331 [Meristemomyces frigidus]|uniref:Epoxide hydrolase N-terminal domain-containing protein n=1 Tax=Meristemomyces frigidus TaxID=1508187 RepID=A0AAN7TKC4_9PEZI|nr:hypothetical protein LTR62_000331 [Meristemomyces frigidus]